jgi:predicted RNA binding protein YcfA (HicA-like mRNA interferase family)
MSPRLPALRSREVIRALERAGFFAARSSGSHHLLEHPDHPGRSVTIAVQATDLKLGTLRSIVKQAGFTVEEFLELL